MRRTMKVLIGSTIRQIVNAVNEQCITKEDIVTLTKEGNQYILIYYK